MVAFEIPVGVVFTSAHEEAILMMKGNINTNPTSTKIESWIEVVQRCKFRIGKLYSICEGDAWVCVVQIVAFKNVCAVDLLDSK
jgi:hypothetical protein